MSSKKGIEVSLTTLLGLAVAAIVIVFIVIPLLLGLYGLYVKKADYVTQQGYARLVYQFRNLEQGKSAVVPLQIIGDFKITTNSQDPACSKNCICLCSEDEPNNNNGCLRKIYKQECLKEEVPSFALYYPNLIFYPKVENLKEGFKVSGISGAANCNFRTTFSECISAECRFFENKCDFCIQGTGCEQYSQRLVGTGYQSQLANSIPKSDAQAFENARDQCSRDPCNLVASGISCEWKEEEETALITRIRTTYGSCVNK